MGGNATRERSGLPSRARGAKGEPAAGGRAEPRAAAWGDFATGFLVGVLVGVVGAGAGVSVAAFIVRREGRRLRKSRLVAWHLQIDQICSAGLNPLRDATVRRDRRKRAEYDDDDDDHHRHHRARHRRLGDLAGAKYIQKGIPTLVLRSTCSFVSKYVLQYMYKAKCACTSQR